MSSARSSTGFGLYFTSVLLKQHVQKIACVVKDRCPDRTNGMPLVVAIRKGGHRRHLGDQPVNLLTAHFGSKMCLASG